MVISPHQPPLTEFSNNPKNENNTFHNWLQEHIFRNSRNSKENKNKNL